MTEVSDDIFNRSSEIEIVADQLNEENYQGELFPKEIPEEIQKRAQYLAEILGAMVNE